MSVETVFNIALGFLGLGIALFFLASKGGQDDTAPSRLKRRKTSLAGKASGLIAAACLIWVVTSDSGLAGTVFFVASIGCLLLHAACKVGEKLARRDQAARWQAH